MCCDIRYFSLRRHARTLASAPMYRGTDNFMPVNRDRASFARCCRLASDVNGGVITYRGCHTDNIGAGTEKPLMDALSDPLK